MNSRSNQRLLWADEVFVRKLDEIRAKKTLNGEKVKSVGSLTSELVNAKSWSLLEDELLRKSDGKTVRIRMDWDWK